MDFNHINIYRLTALFKQPPLSSTHNICLLPFKFEVWMVTFFTLLIFVVLFVILSHVTKKFKKNDEDSLTVLDSVTIVHGAICQQGILYTSMNYDQSRYLKQITEVIIVVIN